MPTPTVVEFAFLLTLVGATACATPPEPGTTREPDAPRAAHLAPPPRPRPVVPPPVELTIDENAAARRTIHRTTLRDVHFTPDTGAYPDVVKMIRALTEVPILITPAARRIIEDEGLALDLHMRSPLSVASLLDLMTDASPSLGWTVRRGVVEIGTTAQASGDIVLRTHDVRDLTFALTEFLPPVIRGIPTGEPTESPRSGGEADEKLSAIEPDSLVEAVRTAVRPDYWDREGGGTLEFVDSGYLLVTATPAVQREVAAALAGLR